MTPLGEIIAQRIRATGPITVAEYMTEALQHARFGYYATRDPLGAAGDFITAPEVSQVFGELIGLWCADAWTGLGRPDPLLLIELGPGRGTLMADALRAIRTVPEFRRALRVHLVETSPALRVLQAKALADANPTWHEALDTVPEAPLIAIANEFLDALPIRQFQRCGGEWRERRIAPGADGESFAFVVEREESLAAAMVSPRLSDAPEGSIAEVCPPAAALCAGLAQRIARVGGAALLIDYGHPRTACGDTLQAVRGHRPHPVLEAPGAADITAHVDFEAVAEAARRAGAAVHGPVAQGAFLRALGIELRERQLLASATAEQAQRIRSGVRRLIDAAEMGTLFKVLAFTHPALAAPAGFAETATP
ncbi:MAG TPA: SAM-dependent methyltransferase [Stellaceae bacterium]|nr:SAM-dependent methyltransferase [Stellaceae bacterium]